MVRHRLRGPGADPTLHAGVDGLQSGRSRLRPGGAVRLDDRDDDLPAQPDAEAQLPEVPRTDRHRAAPRPAGDDHRHPARAADLRVAHRAGFGPDPGGHRRARRGRPADHLRDRPHADRLPRAAQRTAVQRRLFLHRPDGAQRVRRPGPAAVRGRAAPGLRPDAGLQRHRGVPRRRTRPRGLAEDPGQGTSAHALWRSAGLRGAACATGLGILGRNRMAADGRGLR